MVFTVTLHGAQHERGSVEEDPAKSLVVRWGKMFNEIHLSSCSWQEVGQSGLFVLEARSD